MSRDNQAATIVMFLQFADTGLASNFQNTLKGSKGMMLLDDNNVLNKDCTCMGWVFSRIIHWTDKF